MKISVIITTILVAQVSASFFDVFHGAVLSVQNSFGKLLSDVVTDVKETVDCTILAVEHVLSLSHDATTRYYDKCGSVTNKTDSASEVRQDASVPKVEVILNLPNNSEYLQKIIPAEIDARINETLSRVLGNYTSHDNVLSIEKVLAKESEQLAGVSVLVKKEMDKLSHEVTADLKNMEKQRDLELSVDTILQEIKVLEKREQNTKNTSEAREIHQVIDQVLGKLDAIEATEANENIKLEEILKDLESNSNNSFVGLRQQFEEWKEEESRHLSEIKSKIEEHEKISDHPGSYNRHGSNQPQPFTFNIDMNRDDVEPVKNSEEISNDSTTHANEKPDNNTSSRMIGDNYDKSFISVAKEPSSSQTGVNKSGFNDTAVTSDSYSTTENPFGSKMIHLFENPTTVGSSDLATLVTTLLNNLTRNYTNETVTDTLGIINSAPVNGNIPPVDLVAGSDIQGSTLMIANEPTTILFTNVNNSNETMTLKNPLQPPETKAIKDAILLVERNTDSGKKESSDSAINNDTVITSSAEIAETEMTSMFQSNNSSKDTVISSTAITMVENTFVNTTSSQNVESSTAATNEFVTTIVTFDVFESNDTMLTSTSSSINVNAPVDVTIPPTESSTAIVNEESSTVTAKKISDNDSDSNNTTLQSTSSNSTPISETIQPEEFSTVTTKIVSDNDSNNTMITNVSSPIVENTLVSGTVKPEETTTASGNEKLSNVSNGTMITSTSLPGKEITLKNKITKSDKTSTATSIIVNNNYSDTTITSTPTLIIRTSESGTVQAIDATTVSTRDEASSDSTGYSPTGTLNTADADDVSSATVVAIPDTISESIPKENYTVTENYETFASTTNLPISFPATLIDTDSTTDAVTSNAFPTAEITTVSDIIEPVETTVLTENLEYSGLSTTPVTNPDEVTNEKTDSIDTVTSTTENADSTAVTEIIQTDEISMASEEQELSSPSPTTQSTIIVTASTVIAPKENITTSESITASRNEEDLKNSPTLEANTSRTPEILNSPDLNFRVRSPPLTITETAPVNREWLTSNTPKQQNYDTKEAPRNNYEFNAPISLSDRLLQTRQPLINPEIPMYTQAVPHITRSLFNGAPKLLTPDKLIPNAPNQQPKIENIALQQAAFDFFDSADERLSHSGSPFSPEEDIQKITNIPSTPLITNAPSKPIDPQRMNYENPSYVRTPNYPIGPPYYFGDGAPATTYIPQGLTTHRPKKTAALANNYKSPPMDYDSFFHTPPRDSEAHQRALKEALQLMADSKRSARIINSIMKKKTKFNARSVFG